MPHLSINKLKNGFFTTQRVTTQLNYLVIKYLKPKSDFCISMYFHII